jgi:hypothetical protein
MGGKGFEVRAVVAVGVNVWDGLPRDVRTSAARMEWLLASGARSWPPGTMNGSLLCPLALART